MHILNMEYFDKLIHGLFSGLYMIGSRMVRIFNIILKHLLLFAQFWLGSLTFNNVEVPRINFSIPFERALLV